MKEEIKLEITNIAFAEECSSVIGAAVESYIKYITEQLTKEGKSEEEIKEKITEYVYLKTIEYSFFCAKLSAVLFGVDITKMEGNK